jgi:hypothetical protein
VEREEKREISTNKLMEVENAKHVQWLAIITSGAFSALGHTAYRALQGTP